jgi:cellulose synthase/poly-beta-1,6-N-acetylglucosamine synthase-like glycosyltransferase
MIVFTIISTLFTLLYAVLMMVYRKGWKVQPIFIPKQNKHSTKISIIIPARNEEHNIGLCLDAIIKQDYPIELYEVIVIDDHSTDNTVEIVNRYKSANVRCIRLSNHPSDNTIAYKKKALSIGIAASTGELIVTTDADCFAGPHWLQNIAAIYEQRKPVMIVAPVDFTNNGSVVQLFQSLDFMSMQGITAASHKLKLGNMSNGANLAFSREAYNAVDGYKGIDHLASGDDYLLMMKMQHAYPDRISYLKNTDAIVKTAPQPDWNSFIQQRIRWASKSGKYDDKKLTSILAFVYLYNVLIFISAFVSFLHLNTIYSYSFFAILFIKTVVELIYLAPVAGFFNKRQELLYFPLLQPLHVLYIVSAGLLGFIGAYKWKGRKVK